VFITITVVTVIGATVTVMTTGLPGLRALVATITVGTVVGATVTVMTTGLPGPRALVFSTITVGTVVRATVTVMTTPMVDIVAAWFSKSLIDSTQTECTTHYACQNGFQDLPPRCVGREGFG
jgi:hypothetical protein